MRRPARRVKDGLAVAVRVQPKASRDVVEGLAEDAAGEIRLKVRVRAAPDKGAANAAVCALLAKALGVPKSAVSVSAGQAARNKTLLVTGDPAALEAALARLSGAGQDRPMLKLRHIHLPAHDPHGLARWYAETFGLEQRGNFVIGAEALLVFAPGEPLREDLVHFGFHVEDWHEVEAWATRLGAADRIERAPGYAGFKLRDPEGNCIEVYWD